MTDVYYRFEDYLQGSGGYSMFTGEWEPGPSALRVQVQHYEVEKKTPNGAWIRDGAGERRFIADRWHKKFANPTLEGARQDFIARKRCLIFIQERRVRDARLAIATAEKNEFERDVAGLPRRLKRVHSWELELLK